MRRYLAYILLWGNLLTFVSFALPAQAVPACICVTPLQAPDADATCIDVAEAKCNASLSEDPAYKKYTDGCVWQGDAATCNESKKTWNDSYQKWLKNKTAADSQAAAQGQSVFASLTKCGSQTTVSGDCADVSIFVILLIEIANYGFTIIGALALLVFIYGGFLMIISAGNSERVEQGKNAMIAAVLGLIIAFGGYLLIQALGDIVGLKSSAGFRLK